MLMLFVTVAKLNILVITDIKVYKYIFLKIIILLNHLSCLCRYFCWGRDEGALV